MESILYVAASFGVALIIVGLVIWKVSRDEEKDHLNSELRNFKGMAFDARAACRELAHKLEHLEVDLDELEEQVNDLAKVQILILKELKKEHQIQPEKDVLVTIEPLPNSRGRSA